ncbi:sushi, von Willebrand factor type A, EGF and pentraxin domain-containing protein 1-like, partial [Mya arenaria]|uniref:sushi, von Willebrand factor type A, EGF and pentraxin domain-containing protein 1-like n=1 Tax=Mya arenaria TaxID=6604 RepID=UPI0022DED60C
CISIIKVCVHQNFIYSSDSVALRTVADFGAGSGPIWLDDVTCQGDEASIDACTFSAWGQQNCGHSEDVGVNCNVTCPVLNVDDTSNDSGGTIFYNTTVTYTCAGGYIHTNGNLGRTCQADGQLDGTSPICTRVTCSVPDVQDTSKDSGTTVVYNTTVTYTCADSYIVTHGSLVRTCQADGQLDGSSPTCTPDCGTVPVVPNSTYTTPTNTLLGARVAYSCNSGYTSSGAETIACLTSGWTTRPVCHPVTCSVPDVEDTSKDSGTMIVYNTTVTYTCVESNIVTNGSLVRTCQADGQLDGTSPTCTPDCGTVPSVPNSTYTTPTNTLLGARVTYSCNSGYTSSGAVIISCSTSGWTTPPVCHPDLGYDCTNTTCTDPNAVCADATLLCSCPTGYFDNNGAALGGTCEIKSTEVSAVLIAVPIASVVVVILAVTTACLIKQRRNRLEANHGNSNTRISETNAICLQTFVSEQDYYNIGEINKPEDKYRTETHNLMNNPAYAYTEGTPVAHVPQTNIDAAIIAQNYTDEHDYDTFQDLIYENAETNGEAIYENTETNGEAIYENTETNDEAIYKNIETNVDASNVYDEI